MSKTKGLALLCFGLYLAASQSYAALATSGSVFLWAEPGSWVGGGIGAERVTWTHGVEGIFSVGRNSDQGVSVSFDDQSWWSFQFAAPTYDPLTNTNNGVELSIGFYDLATRFPFNSPTRPGFSFSGNGRGNNRLGAWFNVLEVVYGPNNEVLKFAADFRQFDESEDMSGPSTYGSLRINSDIPLNPVPVPPALALLGTCLAFLVRAVKPQRSRRPANP
ncbi:MAG: hypothetical protein AAF384_06705 [Pseudomonadota bacterium]